MNTLGDRIARNKTQHTHSRSFRIPLLGRWSADLKSSALLGPFPLGGGPRSEGGGLGAQLRRLPLGRFPFARPRVLSNDLEVALFSSKCRRAESQDARDDELEAPIGCNVRRRKALEGEVRPAGRSDRGGSKGGSKKSQSAIILLSN